MSFFTQEEKKALTLFFLKLNALPLILLAATMFFLGFYVSDVLKNKTIADYETKLILLIEEGERAKATAKKSVAAIKQLNAESALESKKFVKQLADLLIKDKGLMQKLDKNYTSLENDLIDVSEKIDLVSNNIDKSISKLQKDISALETKLEAAQNDSLSLKANNVEQ